jgi:hypothetical protein
MNEIKRIEKAVESIEYKTYGAMAGAALVGALLGPKERQDEALKQYGELIAKQAEVVRRG